MKNELRIFSIVLCLIFCFSPFGISFRQLVSAKNAVPEGYFEISDAESLYAIRNNPSANYFMTADIDLSELTAEGGDFDTGHGWIPIPDFSGIFDGNGHVIIGMRIVDPSDYAGLFQSVTDGLIKNLLMENVIIDAGNFTVGGIVGYLSGSIENCKVNASINGDGSSGGIAGYMINGSIVRCSTSGTIKGSCAGGIIGASYSKSEISINNCFNTAEINGNTVGGLIGFSGADSFESYLDNYDYQYGPYASKYYCFYPTIITNCYNTGTIIGDSYAGGLVGEKDSRLVVSTSVNCGTIKCDSVKGAIIGYSFRYYRDPQTIGNSKYSNSQIDNNTISYCYYIKTTVETGCNNISDSSFCAVALTSSMGTKASFYTQLDFDNTWFIDVDSGITHPQLQNNPEQRIVRAGVTFSPETSIYNGAVKNPTVKVVDIFGKELTVGADYTITLPEGRCAVGLYTYTIKGINQYDGITIRKEYQIEEQLLTSDSVTLSLESAMYSGDEITPTIVVKNSGGATLAKNADYAVSVPVGRTNVGQYTYTVTGKGNYTGTVTKQLTITAQPLNADSISFQPKSVAYDGTIKQITFVVRDKKGQVIEEGIDYTTICPVEIKKEGDYVFTFTGIGNYSDTVKKTYTVEPHTIHVWDSGVTTTAATCINTGIKTYTCAVCGDTKTETLSKNVNNHAGGIEVKNAKDATCKETGYTGDTYCKGCNARISTGIVIDKLTVHIWDGGKITTAATCTKDGVKTYTCSVCNATKTEAIKATGHSYGAWTKLNDTQHQRVCANDKTHLEKENHNWDDGVITKEPTTERVGEKAFTCNKCGATKTEVIPKIVSYTVKYDANGGNGAPSAQTKTEGKTLTISSTKPTKSFKITYNANGGNVSSATKTVSCTFKNWNTAKDGSGTSYASGASYTKDAAVTLYAQWTNPKAGTLAAPARSGYVFDGWYTAASGGSKVTDATVIPADTTLFAHWTKSTPQPTGKWTQSNQFWFANSSEHFRTGQYTISQSDLLKLNGYIKKNYSSDYAQCIINGITAERNSKWGGSCFGMAMASILDYTGQIGFNENFDKGKATLHDVSSPSTNSEVQSAINYYYLAQYIPMTRYANESYQKGSSAWSSGLKRLVNKAKNNQIMLFCYFFSRNGHAIVIKGYNGTDSLGNHLIVAYDNRYPDKDVIVKISADYSSCIVNGNEYATAIEYLSDFDAYDKIDIDGPNNDLIIQSAINASEEQRIQGTEISVVVDGDLMIQNKEGKNIVIKDGIITSTLDIISTHLIVHSTPEGDAAPPEIVFTVADSDYFTFESSNGSLSASMLTADRFSSVTADNADSAILSTAEGVSVLGDNSEYTVFSSVEDDGCDMFCFSGVANGSANVQYENGSIMVSGNTPGVITAGKYSDDDYEEFSFNSTKKTVSIKLVDTTDSVVLGDVDGDGKLSSADARLALRASVGLEPDIKAGSDAYKAADADGDGKVSSADARLILRASVGLEDPKTFGAPKTIEAKTTLTAAQVAGAIASRSDLFEESLAESSGSRGLTLFGIDSFSVTEASYYAATAAVAEEILVVKLAPGASADAVRSAFAYRQKIQAEDYKDYVPKEVPKINNAVIYQNGDIMVFCVSSDSAAVRSMLDRLF